MRRSIACCSLAFAAITVSACTDQSTSPLVTDDTGGASTDGWLRGTVDERFETVAAQLGGFGVTMDEVGRRYGELHFAGQDRNWEYAAYQIAEMEAVIEFGLQRRPARAASAAMLTPALNAVKAAVAERDHQAFDRAFIALTGSCNACHAAEAAAFVRVAPPKHRSSPVSAIGERHD